MEKVYKTYQNYVSLHNQDDNKEDEIEYEDAKYKEAFSYKNINEQCCEKKKDVLCKGYIAHNDPVNHSNFIFLRQELKQEVGEKTLGLQAKRTKGWKFHVSLDDIEGDDNLERVWA